MLACLASCVRKGRCLDESVHMHKSLLHMLDSCRTGRLLVQSQDRRGLARQFCAEGGGLRSSYLRYSRESFKEFQAWCVTLGPPPLCSVHDLLLDASYLRTTLRMFGRLGNRECLGSAKSQWLPSGSKQLEAHYIGAI